MSSVYCPPESFHLSLKSTKPAKWPLLHRPPESKKRCFSAVGEGLAQHSISLQRCGQRDSQTPLFLEAVKLRGTEQFQSCFRVSKCLWFSPSVWFAQKTTETLLAGGRLSLCGCGEEDRHRLASNLCTSSGGSHSPSPPLWCPLFAF